MKKNNGILTLYLQILSYTQDIVLMLLIFLLSMTLFVSCIQKKQELSDEYEHPSPPFITVCFVPLDGVNTTDVKKLSEDFESNFTSKQWEPYFIQVLNASEIPDSCFNSIHTRYSAKKIIAFLENKYAKIAQKKQ